MINASQALVPFLCLCYSGLLYLSLPRMTSNVLESPQLDPLESGYEFKPSGMDFSMMRRTFQSEGKQWPAIKNDLMIRAGRGEIGLSSIPVWMMRQAGRYLPEFKAIRAEHNFLQTCQDPDLASEVTIQPYRRFKSVANGKGLDGCVVFSDILTIPVAMGQTLEMIPGVGPVLSPKLQSPDDMSWLQLKPDVDSSLGYVFDAVFASRTKLRSEVPVLGFSGAPWSLLGYMVEGGGSKTWANARSWLYKWPTESKRVLTALTDVIIEYLVGQVDAGASLLQVFDTNAGEVPPQIYLEFMVPDLLKIAEEVKSKRPEAVLILFPRDANLLSVFDDSKYDAVSISWKMQPGEARKLLPSKALQGNLDPCALFGGEEVIKRETLKMIEGFGKDRYIANLGHGMMPEMTPDMAHNFIKAVKM